MTYSIVETDRHIRRNPTLGIHQIVERLPRHAQDLRGFSDGQT